MGSKCDPLPSSSNSWIRPCEKIDFRFNYTPDCTVSRIWIFKNFLGGSPSPLLRPLPLLNLRLRPRFGLRSQFSGVSRLRFRLFPQYSSGASCLGSGIDLDSPMFISSQQGRSPPDPYSVSVFRKIKIFSFQSFNIDSYTNVSTPRTKFFN